MNTTLLTLVLAIPIQADIPHADRYGGAVQVCDIVSPWTRPVPPVSNGADAWMREQKRNVVYHTPPGQLRRRRPCVPEPATVLVLGSGWLWMYRSRVRR